MNFNLNKYPTKNIEYISCLDVKNLQNTIYDYVSMAYTDSPYTNEYTTNNSVRSFGFVDYNPTESKVIRHFNNDIYEMLNYQNLHWYLGIPDTYFDCIFHNDTESKASIFMKQDGDWVYKCFYDKCPFKIGDINKITECITGLNRPKTLEFLMSVYGIVLEKNEWQIEQEEIINSNIDLLLNVNYLQSNYPTLYARIKTYIPQLLILHEFAKRNLTLEQVIDSNYVTFTAPMRQISNELLQQNKSSSISTVSKRNNILTFIGMLMKLSDSEIPENELKELQEFAHKNGYNNYQNFYALPSYAYGVLNDAEDRAIEFKELGMTVKAFNRRMITKGFTDEELRKVYPRQETNYLNKFEEQIADFIKLEVMNQIGQHGFCVEKKIYNNGNFINKIKRRFSDDDKNIKKGLIERIFKSCVPELINSYDLKRSRLTNCLKEQFKLDNYKGNPTILYL